MAFARAFGLATKISAASPADQPAKIKFFENPQMHKRWQIMIPNNFYTRSPLSE